MGQPYVTGPIPIILGVGPGNTPRFLGYCERMPSRQIRPQYSPLYVDIGGTMVPFDLVKQGADAIITCDVSYFDYTTYNFLVNSTSEAATAPGDLGTLMMTEQGTTLAAGFGLWMPFPYVAKASMPNMWAGEHYLCAMCMNDDLSQLGTVAQKKRLVFHCIRRFDPTVVNSFGRGGFKLLDQDMSAISGIVAA